MIDSTSKTAIYGKVSQIFSEIPKIRVSENPTSRKAEFPKFRVSENPSFRKSEFPKIPVPEGRVSESSGCRKYEVFENLRL